jgi:hypothetical protein
MFVKATITHLTTLESLRVLWNPESYRVTRVNHFAAPAVLAQGRSPLQVSTGGVQRFRTRLFLDASEETGSRRDLRGAASRLESWSEPAGALPPKLLFAWGSFRFTGVIEELREEWIRFDEEGTPTRGWMDLVLRG